MRGFADLPAYSELPMPALSPTMETGTIAKWLKVEGEAIGAGDLIAEVETDKATVDYEAQDDCFMARIFMPEGSADVPVGQCIAITVDNEEDIAAFANFTAEDVGGSGAAAEPATPAASPAAPTRPPPSTPAPSATSTGDRVFASPLAKMMIRESNVALDLATIAGSGPNGRVLKDDVTAAMAAASAAPPAPVVEARAAPQAAASAPVATAPVPTATPAMAMGPFSDEPASRIRQIIARSTTASKQNVPHYYLTVELCIDELMSTRAKLNAMGGDQPKISVNDFVIKAAALACKAVPGVNSSWVPEENVVRTYEYVDVNVGMSTDMGLISPVVRDADSIGLRHISTRVRGLAAGAKEGTLTPEDHSSGTFTISNLGMFGIKQFTAIISEPQACILAVGAAEDRLVPAPADAADGGAAYAVEKRMNVTLSCDHRVVDGAVGAQWLQVFKKLMQDPMSMLL